jgi:CheY-like chemotaxis protein
MARDRQLDGISVLVVEDSLDSRAVMEEVLRQHGATVLGADSAVSALRIVDKFRPDVLLSDIGLPSMDGYTLLKKVREMGRRKRRAEIPAAAITAFTSASDIRKSSLAGFRCHLSKPFIIDELISTVARLAGRTDASSGDRRAHPR